MLYYIACSLDNASEDSNTVIKALLTELPSELEGDIMTLGEQLYSKGKLEGRLETVEATYKAIDLIHQGAADAAIVAQTALTLTMVQQLRKALLH